MELYFYRFTDEFVKRIFKTRIFIEDDIQRYYAMLVEGDRDPYRLHLSLMHIPLECWREMVEFLEAWKLSEFKHECFFVDRFIVQPEITHYDGICPIDHWLDERGEFHIVFSHTGSRKR